MYLVNIYFTNPAKHLALLDSAYVLFYTAPRVTQRSPVHIPFVETAIRADE
jgi:hypothetical protein